ncbi:hypothetical protein FALBO_5637 [Fusarium albosuccineum]|uniref:Uncharacterized protein n=1 Tax=Fusarium albosuccineum TaxID=1237068 RepID=A0A8H4LD87_9HYPO|nr:hypothetical protein FALBO_5637 [Fusarium albosuccineum]
MGHLSLILALFTTAKVALAAPDALILTYRTATITQCFAAGIGGMPSLNVGGPTAVIEMPAITGGPVPIQVEAPSCQACGCNTCVQTVTYEATYDCFCAQGLCPQVYAVTETYRGMTAPPTVAETDIPFGFTCDVQTCYTCGPTPITATITHPVSDKPYITNFPQPPALTPGVKADDVVPAWRGDPVPPIHGDVHSAAWGDNYSPSQDGQVPASQGFPVWDDRPLVPAPDHDYTHPVTGDDSHIPTQDDEPSSPQDDQTYSPQYNGDGVPWNDDDLPAWSDDATPAQDDYDTPTKDDDQPPSGSNINSPVNPSFNPGPVPETAPTAAADSDSDTRPEVVPEPNNKAGPPADDEFVNSPAKTSLISMVAPIATTGADSNPEAHPVSVPGTDHQAAPDAGDQHKPAPDSGYDSSPFPSQGSDDAPFVYVTNYASKPQILTMCCTLLIFIICLIPLL